MSNSIDCHYHPANPATWFCTPCDKHFGDCCVPAPPADYQEQARCAFCRQPLRWLGAAHSAEPFWNRINYFFLYPLQRNALSVLGFCALLILVSASTGVGLLPVGVMVLALLAKFCFQVLELTARGETEPPSLPETLSGSGFELFIKQAAIIITAMIAMYYLGKTGSLLLVLAGAAFIFIAWPASTMLLAWTGSFRAAVSPPQIISLIRAVGWPYALLCLFLTLLNTGSEYAVAAMVAQMEFGLALPAYVFFTAYFSLVMFVMMGHCLYQSQGALGFAADAAPPSDLSVEAYLKQKALAEAEILVREGRIEEAARQVRVQIDSHPNDVLLHQRYQRLLMEMSNTQKLPKHGRVFLNLLAGKGNWHSAADAYLNVTSQVPDFQPETAEQRHYVAEALIEQRRFREGLRLLQNFHKEHPAYTGLAEAYLLAARAFAEGLNDDARALKLLQFVGARFPNDPCAREAARYQSMLQA